MHVPKILRDTHIQILWNGAAVYPTPRLKINNWENVKIQDIVSWKKKMSMYRNNMNSQDNSHTLRKIAETLMSQHHRFQASGWELLITHNAEVILSRTLPNIQKKKHGQHVKNKIKISLLDFLFLTFSIINLTMSRHLARSPPMPLQCTAKNIL